MNNFRPESDIGGYADDLKGYGATQEIKSGTTKSFGTPTYRAPEQTSVIPLHNDIPAQKTIVSNASFTPQAYPDHSAEISKLNERLTGMGRMLTKEREESNKLITDLTSKLESTLEYIAEVLAKCSMKKYEIRPNKSETIGKISKAISMAKFAIGAIDKSGKSNRGSFASIEDMTATCDPILKEHALSIVIGTNRDEYNNYQLTLILSHESGEWFEFSAPLNELNELDVSKGGVYHQKVLAAEKYLRRSMYRSVLNLSETSD